MVDVGHCVPYIHWYFSTFAFNCTIWHTQVYNYIYYSHFTIHLCAYNCSKKEQFSTHDYATHIYAADLQMAFCRTLRLYRHKHIQHARWRLCLCCCPTIWTTCSTVCIHLPQRMHDTAATRHFFGGLTCLCFIHS